MNKVICMTTVQSPTEATRKFAAMKDWKLVIAGDKITPHEDYQDLKHEFPNVYYLLPDVQDAIDSRLSDLIGWRSIQRRNFAFLYACKELKADILASCDDDNVPMDGWGENLMVGKEAECFKYVTEHECADPLTPCTGRCEYWHRGFPLELIHSRPEPDIMFSEKLTNVIPDIQADLWLGEPDVDAVGRLTSNGVPDFLDDFFPVHCNKPSPFNSQNTFLHKDVMPHYFMHIERGRFDDILASYFVQSKGFRVVYGKPSVRQERNEHDVMKDFANEIWGYQNILSVIRDLKANPDNLFNWLTPRGAEAFRLYQKHFE